MEWTRKPSMLERLIDGSVPALVAGAAGFAGWAGELTLGQILLHLRMLREEAGGDDDA